MEPLSIYLDTADFSVMSSARPDTTEYEVRRYLTSQVEQGKIVIGASYFNVFELLQKSELQYQHERLRRAGFLRDICNGHAYPHIEDFTDGSSISRDGIWYPRKWFRFAEIERFAEKFRKDFYEESGALGQPRFTRQARRRLKKRGEFAAFIAENPDLLTIIEADLSAPQLAHQVFSTLRRYLGGELSRSEANSVIRKAFADPVLWYEAWFQKADYASPIEELKYDFYHNLLAGQEMIRNAIGKLRKLEEECRVIEKMIENIVKVAGQTHPEMYRLREQLRRIRRDMRATRASPAHVDLLRAKLRYSSRIRTDITAITSSLFNSALVGELRLEESTGMDVMHACYLPLVDLWRGDRRVAHALRARNAPHAMKIVHRLAELPSSVEEALDRRVKLPLAS